MASPSPLFLALLRPPVLQILRAAGFTTARPSTIDTLVDITSRYIILLASRTAIHARAHTGEILIPPAPTDDLDALLDTLTANTEKDPNVLEESCWSTLEAPNVTIPDIRQALLDTGALHPQLAPLEEAARGAEDMRGVENFVAWCKGAKNAEIRRIAGFAPTSSNTVGTTSGKDAMPVPEAPEDFLTHLKKKHAKSGAGEESRYAGTVLGKDLEEQEVTIEGWEGIRKLETWGQMVQEKDIQKVNSRGEEGETMEIDVNEKQSSDSSLSEHDSLDSDV